MKKTIQELCIEYGCDKTPEIGHTYAPVYDELFKELKNVKSVLEIGVGYPRMMKGVVNKRSSSSGHMYDYKAGVSLRIWREYFPDANIFGIDINSDALVFGEEKIKTLLGDATDDLFVTELMKDIGPLDLVIDDGSHRSQDQLKSAQLILPYMGKGGMYFIEDVFDASFLVKNLGRNRVERVNRSRRGGKLLLIRS